MNSKAKDNPYHMARKFRGGKLFMYKENKSLKAD